jgi:hypothetical protein
VLNPLYPPIASGKDGTFTLKGIGRERVALVRIEGEGIETTDVMLMTRTGDAVLPGPIKRADSAVPQFPGSTTHGRYAVFGAKAKITVAPGRAIAGVVRDLDTGKPVPGAVVRLTSAGGIGFRTPERMTARTDAEGRYRLDGVPVRRDCAIAIDGPADLPYLATSAAVPREAGVGPVTLDLKLKRGIWAIVRVIDKTDNTPVAGDIQYFVPADNPHVKEVQNLRPVRARKGRVTDDSYRVAVLPGKGIVAVQIGGDHPFVSLASPRAPFIDARPFSFRPRDYLAYVRIDPAVDAKEVKCEIGLTRGTE